MQNCGAALAFPEFLFPAGWLKDVQTPGALSAFKPQTDPSSLPAWMWGSLQISHMCMSGITVRSRTTSPSRW